MNEVVEERTKERALLREAAEWRMLSLLLERPRGGWLEEVTALAAETPELGAISAAARDAEEGHYLRLLGPGGQVSPREVAYRPMGDPGNVMADLQAFYQAFGFEPRTEEPPDHIAVEAGFAGYLKLKQAHAVRSGYGSAARITGNALKRFLDSHLAAFACAFAERTGAVEDSYLSQSAAAVATRVLTTAKS